MFHKGARKDYELFIHPILEISVTVVIAEWRYHGQCLFQ